MERSWDDGIVGDLDDVHGLDGDIDMTPAETWRELQEADVAEIGPEKSAQYPTGTPKQG